MRHRRDSPILSLPDASAPFAVQSTAAVINEDGGISLAQIIAILSAYWKWSLLIAISVVVVAAGVIKLLPKKYTSTATLIVNYEVNDPLGGKDFPIGLLNSYMTTQIQIIQSSAVMLSAVDRLKITENSDYAAGYVNKGLPLRDYVKERLQKDVQISIANQLLYISATAKDPWLAASIANAIADTYTEQQSQRINDPVSEHAKRYATQLMELKNKVAVAQERVNAYRQQTGITDIGIANNDTEATLLTGLQQQYQEAQNQRRNSEVRSNQTNTTEARASAIIQQLRQQLLTNQSTLAQLRTSLGPKHPKVVELNSQIDSINAALSTELRNVSSTTQDDLRAAKELEEKLRRAVEAQRNKLLNVRTVQDEGTKLVLELESAQSLYKRALDGYDQIMVASSSRYNNVSFISRAEPPLVSARPNKPKLFVMAFFAACLLGIATPFGYEFFVNRRIRCRDDLERDLGISVLAELDAIPSMGLVE